MDENKNHPIRFLTNLLCDLIIRLTETERELNEARKSSDDWYQNWQRKDAQLKETEAKLAAEIEAHQKLKDKINGHIEKQEGATENGESN